MTWPVLPILSCTYHLLGLKWMLCPAVKYTMKCKKILKKLQVPREVMLNILL
jgi:hypothetical protein